MDKEIWSFFKDAFCSHLKIIKSEIERNDGMFKSSQMLDDALDCIRGVKDLHKIKTMTESAPTQSATRSVL